MAKMDLIINEEKTKCTQMSPTQVKVHFHDIAIDDFICEKVNSFTHLGRVPGNGNNMLTDIDSEILRVNRE
jgi:hypothetical protein